LKHLQEAGAGANDWVLVHDAARCLVTPRQVEALIAACQDDAVGGLLAQPLADTLKDASPSAAADDAPRVRATVPRAGKWLAQTPQMFRLGALVDALHKAGPQVTDEASAMEAAGRQPRLVAAAGPNFKITYPEDLALAEHILAARAPAAPSGFRMGEGWDIHALVPGRPLILGGVQIPFDKGLDGHSDADVLLHAITDAVLGAAGLGDIGRHFPDTDARFKGADSRALLREAGTRVRAAGFQISNVDSTVVAQAPKLAPHIGAMCQSIADTLGLAVGQVNVKAKTAERMGPVGEGRAMEARAVALLVSVKPHAET
jgi:2-C-methyl-D-erythritol 4-phosphate cytidylyltransferase/2-C-methyl-D-erythritol 2,4-cyclodiphosphate synthase